MIKVLTTRHRMSLVWTIVGIFVVSTVYLTIQASATGAKLAQLERERVELTKTNETLTKRLMNHTSLTQIQLQAEDQGFVHSDSRVYVKSGLDSVADSSKTNF